MHLLTFSSLVVALLFLVDICHAVKKGKCRNCGCKDALKSNVSVVELEFGCPVDLGSCDTTRCGKEDVKHCIPAKQANTEVTCSSGRSYSKPKCTVSFRLMKIPLTSNKDPQNVAYRLKDAGIIIHKEFCPDGWVSYKSSCYLFPNLKTPKLTFSAAEDFCIKQGGHLVKVDDSDENDFLKGFLESFDAPRTWMGLNDLETEGEYRWISDQSVATWFDWLPGDPNNYNNEDCCLFYVRHDRKTYEWVDAPCSWDEKPLCERSKYWIET